MLYLFISVEKYFSVSELNARIASFDFPEGERPPYIFDTVAAGKHGGLPKDGAHLRFTGSQTMYFTLHSIDLLGPLIPNMQHPAWQSWCAHVDYVRLLLADSFTSCSLVALDAGIQKHHRLYDKVPQDEGRFRPKHHFATHFPLDILNCGPGHLPSTLTITLTLTLKQGFKAVLIVL